MKELHMRVGPNIGKILLEIAQTNVENGNPEKAIKTYTQSLPGFTEEYVLMLLTNKAVLIAEEDGTGVRMTNWENEIVANRENIFDWHYLINKAIEEIDELRDGIYFSEREFDKVCRCGSIDSVNLSNIIVDYFGEGYQNVIGIHNLAAKLIAGDKFADLYSSGENVWEDLEYKVESECAEKYQIALYMIVHYVNSIRNLCKEFIRLAKMYKFLIDKGLVKHYPFIEKTFETSMSILVRFINGKGYYHPMCDTKLCEEKEKMHNELLTTHWGKEFLQYGIIEKDILDGYDAGYLSPEGVFFGNLGATGNMIHMNLAEQLFKGRLAPEMAKDGVTVMGSYSPERWLDEKGYLKIHHNEIYGVFMGIKNEKNPTYQYCPTDIQIKMICNYADKNYNGKIYTQPQIVKTTDPISTSKLRQMDEIMLHEIFRI